MDDTVFLANFEQVLVPTLKSGDVVVRDTRRLKSPRVSARR